MIDNTNKDVGLKLSYEEKSWNVTINSSANLSDLKTMIENKTHIAPERQMLQLDACYLLGSAITQNQLMHNDDIKISLDKCLLYMQFEDMLQELTMEAHHTGTDILKKCQQTFHQTFNNHCIEKEDKALPLNTKI